MIKTVGVVGAGQMGEGIVQVCATSGFDVMLFDSREESVQKALHHIEKNLEKMVSRNKIMDAEKKKALKHINPVPGISAFSKCDFIIEAVSENEAVKRAVIKEISDHSAEDTIIATNTSSITITGLASVTHRPDKFIGMHFMNPVPVMQLVEVICGLTTSKDTFNKTIGLVEQLGKQKAVAHDFPGFIVNRILMPMINEACYALLEGVGDVISIDTGMKLGANHPMGPLELADLIGLDTCLAIMQVLHKGLNGSKYQPCPLLVQYVEAGWLGRKTKKGFYDYSGEKPVPSR